MKISRHMFEKMTSLENLFRSWDQFIRGKIKRKDIQYFVRYLEDFLFELHEDLISNRYRHGTYEKFYVCDPKRRHISKATVRDRLVHQVVYSALIDVYDKTFLFHSLSCRIGKGTHVGISVLRAKMRKVSKNGTKPCFALKMDIRRFFDSIDHMRLKSLLQKRVQDERAFDLIVIIIDSFYTKKINHRITGIPLGNVTSQIFANIYLHELDLFIKHGLGQKHYLRYCDDFIIMAEDEGALKNLIPSIESFLMDHLFLELHPQKTIISKLSGGVDFLGYVNFLNHRVLRTSTKKRMLKRLRNTHSKYVPGERSATDFDQSLQSYLGILSHANQFKLSETLKNAYWSRSNSESGF